MWVQGLRVKDWMKGVLYINSWVWGHGDVLHANGSDQKITDKILARSAAIASLVIVKSIAIL